MKRKFMYLMATAIIAVGFVGCEKGDVEGDNGDGPNYVEGSETYAQLTILDGSAGTRGATAEDPATAVESKIDVNKMKVFVFKGGADGSFETAYLADSLGFTENTVNQTYVSKGIKVNSGKKYIYVFSDPKDLIPLVRETDGSISTPSVSMTRKQFETQLLSIDFSGTRYTNLFQTAAATTSETNPDVIAEDNKFLIGTLWGEEVNVPAGGTKDKAVDLGTVLKLGRATAKIKLTSVAKGATSPLKGTISDAKYKLNSVPVKAYAVGQWSGTGNVPGKDSHNTPVTSAVHTSTTAGDYMHYFGTGVEADWAKTGIKSVDGTSFYYAVENTSNNSLKSTITHIHLQVKYTPDASEVKTTNAQGKIVAGTLTGDTFWRFKFTDATTGQVTYYIFDSATPVVDGALGTLTEGAEFKNGKMYYSFPIEDKLETADPLQQKRVLRNHSYDVAVRSISNFGNNSGDVEGGEFETETYVTVEISVMPWSKVTQITDL